MVAKCIWRGPQRSAVLRTEYRGLETSGRRLLGNSVLSGLNPNFVDAMMCTVQMGERCSVWLKAHGVC